MNSQLIKDINENILILIERVAKNSGFGNSSFRLKAEFLLECLLIEHPDLLASDQPSINQRTFYNIKNSFYNDVNILTLFIIAYSFKIPMGTFIVREKIKLIDLKPVIKHTDSIITIYINELRSVFNESFKCSLEKNFDISLYKISASINYLYLNDIISKNISSNVSTILNVLNQLVDGENDLEFLLNDIYFICESKLSK